MLQVEKDYTIENYYTEGGSVTKQGIKRRIMAVNFIYKLHQEKGYKHETVFRAISVLDRYLARVGHANIPKVKFLRLVIVVLLIGAKLEQTLAPSFSLMIELLDERDREKITIDSLYELEMEVLSTLSYDFEFPGPVPFLERYMRLFDHDKNETIRELSFLICKFS